MNELNSPIVKLHYVPIFNDRKIKERLYLLWCEESFSFLVCKTRKCSSKITKIGKRKKELI